MDRWEKSVPRIPISTVLVLGAARAIHRLFPKIKRLHLVGSRLRHKYGRDIEFVAVVDRPEDMPGRNVINLKVGNMKVDLFFATAEEAEPTILEFGLGRDIMRWKRAAIAKGLKLNRYGLWNGSVRVTNRMDEIAAILGMELKPHLVFSLKNPL